MAKILILGGGGMVGQKLVGRLQSVGLDGSTDHEIILYDLGFPGEAPAGVTHVTGNLSEPGQLEAMVDQRPDVIFHLASIVSGEAEVNFTKGWDVNMLSMWRFLEAIRAAHEADGYHPKLIFTSSIAVFGGPYPEAIDDEFFCAPQTSYGAQKLINETLVADFARKGFCDGMSLRFPTICVRPGKANMAASSFFSGIIREPLAGKRAVLPVEDSVRHWHASPRAAAGFLTHAAELPDGALGSRRSLNLPGLSCTVAEQIEALRDVAGQGAVDLIDPVPDAAVAKIVHGWPRNFTPTRALGLGFKAESSFREIIEVHIADDRGGS